MKALKVLLAAALPILSAACASFPGVSIVDRPSPMEPARSLPPPLSCLTPPLEPATNNPPQLPELIPPPAGSPRSDNDAAWYRLAARHFESRARRAELTQSFAVNVADAERDARISNQVTQQTCAFELQERVGDAPVG